MPSNDVRSDVRNAREQITGAVGDAFEQVRTPLLAALGASDLATQAVVDLVNRARAQVTKSTTASSVDIAELRAKLESSEFTKLVDREELRKLVDPNQLRELLDDYANAAVELYKYLAEHGEGALDRLRAQPQVKKALEQLEEAVNAAQERVEGVASDARDIAEDVLARVTRQTRVAGEKTARTVEDTAVEVADTAIETGGDLAQETRKAAGKVANKTAPAPRKPATPRKTNGAARTEK
jgi:heparin binding hemagglutinin HbhA